MQEYSQYILEVRDVPTARKMFIDKYGQSQLPVFEDEVERAYDYENTYTYWQKLFAPIFSRGADD